MSKFRSALNDVFLILFAGVPTVFLFAEYKATGNVPWWLAVVWFVVMVFSIGVTYGKGD